jgi:hypothetical protein
MSQERWSLNRGTRDRMALVLAQKILIQRRYAVRQRGSVGLQPHEEAAKMTPTLAAVAPPI